MITSASNATRRNNPNHGLENAMGDVSDFVREISNALIKKISSKAKLTSQGLRALEQVKNIRDNISRLIETTKESPLLQQITVPKFKNWLRITDNYLTALEDFEEGYNFSPREIKRFYSEQKEIAVKLAESLRDLKESMLDYMEFISPTPENYLEDEIKRIHGDESEDLISGFIEIAASEQFSMEAFKKRHNLK